MDDVLHHAQACVKTAMQMRAFFEDATQTTEGIAAHALFLRCVDHFQAAVILSQRGLDVEALSLTRGIVETTFIIGALLEGFLTTAELERFDLAQKAKNAREMSEFLSREASIDLQQKMSEYGDKYKGPTDVRLQQLAQKIGMSELYDGNFRTLSHVATHPSMSSIQKYLKYGELATTVHYPGQGLPPARVLLMASINLIQVCAGLEKWLGTNSSVNQAINERLAEHESLWETFK